MKGKANLEAAKKENPQDYADNSKGLTTHDNCLGEVDASFTTEKLKNIVIHVSLIAGKKCNFLTLL